jgi:hypothetical protein
MRRNILDGADFVRDVRNIYLNVSERHFPVPRFQYLRIGSAWQFAWLETSGPSVRCQHN